MNHAPVHDRPQEPVTEPLSEGVHTDRLPPPEGSVPPPVELDFGAPPPPPEPPRRNWLPVILAAAGAVVVLAVALRTASCDRPGEGTEGQPAPSEARGDTAAETPGGSTAEGTQGTGDTLSPVTDTAPAPATEATDTGDTASTATQSPTDAPTDASTEAPSDAPTELPGDVPTDPPTDTPTEIPTDAPTDTEPVPTEPETVPEGCFAIERTDLSAPERPVGYIVSTADRLPPSIPGAEERLWSTAGAPTVLIVHTHPYEGYGDGGAYYDPATGDLAQTDSPSAPDGVVALGAELTRVLREQGVTVIHLRVPVSDGESAGSTYARTQAMVDYYCGLYPEIGLVLDLRRSAELSDGGAILAPTGTLDGAACAQLRLSVGGGRATEAVSRDIALAVALRRELWAIEPTVSRPVWVKSGAGLCADAAEVAVLTVELGAAGSTFEEAARLIEPLGQVLAEQVLSEK